MSDKNTFENLSNEIKAKLRECSTEEEMSKVLEEAGVELDVDALEAVSGGALGACRNDRSRLADSPSLHDCVEISKCRNNKQW